jgi:murein DD-endopeptidase MepM/ murein hydrolase activator NlpD
MKNDYKDSLVAWSPSRRQRRRRWPIVITLLTGLGLAVSLSAGFEEWDSPEQAASVVSVELPAPSGGTRDPLLTPTLPDTPVALPATDTRRQAPSPAEPEQQVAVPPATPLNADELQTAAPDPMAQPVERHEVVVRAGDTLSGIFDRLGIAKRELYELLQQKESKARLTRLKPGQVLEFSLQPETGLQSLRYRIDAVETLEVNRGDSGFASTLLREELDRRVSMAMGEIDSSLFLAGQKSGLSDNLIMQMVEVLGWDIDFALDIRAGDRFTVVYEELFNRGGVKIRDGNILAVEFVNQGHAIRAVRYQDPDGDTEYFSPDGHSMRKAFLRTPVSFSRISSGFTTRRWHPVLHRFRAHKGVDYAAPTGTPVKATGRGKVRFIGRKGGYGRTIVLQHGGNYTTLYAHLSRFARGLRSGQRVRQGQIIGYVGQSGLATGPHLHYEFRVRGQHRNPLTVKLPQAMPIASAFRDDFSAQTRPLLVQLDLLRRASLARNEDEATPAKGGPS